MATHSGWWPQEFAFLANDLHEFNIFKWFLMYDFCNNSGLLQGKACNYHKVSLNNRCKGVIFTTNLTFIKLSLCRNFSTIQASCQGKLITVARFP